MHTNPMERDVILLHSATESLDSVLNLFLIGLSSKTEIANAYFHTQAHQTLFYIYLVDILSVESIFFSEKKHTTLSMLSSLLSRNTIIHGDTTTLKSTIIDFENWLNTSVSIDAWLATISTQANLNITRLEFIKICGNISKHNTANLTNISKRISTILTRSGVSHNDLDRFTVIEDFENIFSYNIMEYHSTTIIYMLNNIRWELHSLLKVILDTSLEYYIENDTRKWRYRIPHQITNSYAINCFWGLMNRTKQGPYIRKFSVDPVFMKRY